ncbi:mRNA splicing factor [Thamnocephalis sphaerospora]|uniref:mRNA splicing factor n=1 Tax=Thamnocephalis sphaerospora TaxID=78915 RepID=A0A4P9XM62_9FUNG|nr:mRNA splicing factor [Thamnocephalis sphaerospora]|eukprot:RKP06451.1 mRNA splicing factor [Thamnocephalis sphaerospora]
MEEEARKRRERLRTLRAAKESGATDGNRHVHRDRADQTASTVCALTKPVDRPTLRFRNYTPMNEDIASEAGVEAQTREEDQGNRRRPPPPSFAGGEDADEADTTGEAARNARKRGAENHDTVERAVAGVTDEVLAAEVERTRAEMDLFTLAPKKANWDLKRDVEKKLARLERRTQASIVELIRQRLQGQDGGEMNLADAVAAQQRAQDKDQTSTTAAAEADDDDDEDDDDNA